MPPVLFRDLLREIRGSIGRYLSILAIVALGVSFFAGIKASAPDMKHSADSYFDKYRVQDIQLYSTIGISEEDLQALRNLPGIEEVQGQFSADFLAQKDSREMTVKVISFTPDQPLNTPRLVEGKLPEKDDECLVQADSATGKIFGNWEIGDTVTLRSGTEAPISDSLHHDSYTVVGKAWNPNYLSYQLGSSSIGSGSVDSFLYVPEDAVASDVFTEADLSVKGARQADTYSEAYFTLTDPAVKKVETLADSQLQTDMDARKKTLEDKRADVEKKLADGQKQIDEASAKLADGKAQLAAHEKELADGKARYESGKAELAASRAEWESGRQQVEDGIRQVDDAARQIHDAQAQLPQLQQQKEQIDQAIPALEALQTAQDTLQAAQDELDRLAVQIDQLQASQPRSPQLISLKARRDVLEGTIQTVLRQSDEQFGSGSDLPSALTKIGTLKSQMLEPLGGSIDSARSLQQQLDDGIRQINEGSARLGQLDSTRTMLEEKRRTLDEARDQIEEGEEKLKASEAQLAQGQQQIDAARQELESGQAEFDKNLKDFEAQKASARAQLAKADQTIQDLSPEWIVLDRKSHYSYRDYEACADRMDGIASVFPVFFFLVAALVCMTTMTRMVDEERSEMGTLKALGYSRQQIAMKYLFYAGSASILGSILGCAVGVIVFPLIIYSAWNIMYNLEAIRFAFQPLLMLSASAIVTGVVLIATWFSISKEMREVPAQLMRPKAAKAGRRILLERVSWIWSKLSFMQKVTMRNLFRYKKRFFMTVIGISGCSALLLAGFGLNDSIGDIVPRQFEAVYHFDATVSAKTDDPQALCRQIESLPGVADCFDLEILPVTVHYDDKDVSASLNIISDPEAFEPFMSFYPMSRSSRGSLDDAGVLLSIKTAEKLGLDAGDELTFKTAGSRTVRVPVSGLFEQYSGHQIYMTRTLFESLGIEETPDPSFLLKNEKTDPDFESDLGARLMDLGDIRSVTFYSATKDNFLNMISSIKMVVIVLVLSAALLAFVVLYNLSNVNISERLREIATIKVLGFTEKEVNAYVNRETIILALIGSVVGLFLGIYLHDLIMNLAEMDTLRFGRTIVWQSYAYSIGLTLFFTLLVNWIMKFRLRKIQMVESLKAVE